MQLADARGVLTASQSDNLFAMLCGPRSAFFAGRALLGFSQPCSGASDAGAAMERAEARSYKNVYRLSKVSLAILLP